MERAIIHPTALFFVGPFPAIPSWFYLMFALLGAAAAGYSVLAMQSVTWAERLLRRLPLPQWLRPAIGGALVAAMALVVPQVLGSGHGAIQELFDRDLGLVFLLVLLVTKLVASAISLGAGFRGGMFSSSLLLGCLFGAVFGQVLTLIVPSLAGQQAVLMLVGMASVAAAVIGSPLTMVFLVLEGTDNFPVTVGVMAGVVVASTIVRLTFGYSFSTWRFHQRGIGIRGAHDVGWLADLTVSRLMRADAKTVPETTPLAELREMFPPGSTKRVFVVSETGEYVGSLDVAALHEEKPPDLAARTARNFAEGRRPLPAGVRERTHRARPLRGQGGREPAGPRIADRAARHRLSFGAIRAAPLQSGARAPAQRRAGRTRPLLHRRAAALE